MKVKEIMTTRVVTVAEDTLVADIAAVLRGHRINAVPVLDTAGAVVGLVSEYDLLAREGATAREVMTREVITATSSSVHCRTQRPATDTRSPDRRSST